MSPDTRPPTHRPRLIEHGEVYGEPRPAIRLPEQWLRGLLAGAEALILSWLVLVVPAVAAYVATAADPALGTAGWVQAAQMGTTGWFLAHGAVLSLGQVQISVVPLGLPLLYAVLMATAVRRARLQQWAPVVVAVCTYVLLGAALLLLDPPPGAWQGMIGAVAVGALGAWWGMRGRALARPGWLPDLPQWWRHGWQGAWRTGAVLAAVALVLVIVSIATSAEQIMDVHRGLHADVVSTVVIVFAQILVLPVLVVWALAFVLGPGFTVGAQTIFSPHGIEAGPLPLIPLLGALPAPDTLAGQMPAVGALGVLTGIGAGWWLVRRQREQSLWQALAAAAVLVTVVSAAVAAAGWLASGSIGPGAMAHLGPAPLAIGWATCWQVGTGTFIAVLALRPETRQHLRTIAGGIRRGRRNTDH